MKDLKLKAKKKMLKELKKAMSDDMHEDLGDKLKSSQKVTVASDSKEGLEAGLSKAQEILKKRREMDDEEGEDYSCGSKYAQGGYGKLKKKKKQK